MMRIVLAGVLGGIVSFMWGFVSHNVLPIGSMGMEELPGLREPAVTAALALAVPDSGRYTFPGLGKPHSEVTEEEMEKHWARFVEGPSGFLVYRVNNAGAKMGMFLAVQFGSSCLCALLIAFVLAQSTGGYFCRALQGLAFGLFAWAALAVPYWNWYGFPAMFTLGTLIDQAVGSLLVGLTVAAIVKARPAGRGA